MLLTLEQVTQKIQNNETLHIAASQDLLVKLPKGNWIGGSTEYFMAQAGGRIANDVAFVTDFNGYTFTIKDYCVEDVKNIANDTYDNGFAILILPFDSHIHKEYAQNAPTYENMFLRTVAGWISGVNLSVIGQTPMAVNGQTLSAYTDKAVAMHIEVDPGKTVALNTVNIFEQDPSSALIEFKEEGFVVKNCLIDGKEVVFAEYLAQNNINTKMPLVGEYSGAGVNVSIKHIENDTVYLYAPVFSGIQYKMAKSITDYEVAFAKQLQNLSDKNTVFACNCILNFLYGGLEGKRMESFAGPITFGEVAYQLVNQTLVYVEVQ